MHTHHIVSLQKTVLVTGASGLLGRDVVRAFDRVGWRVVGTALNRVDPPRIIKLDLLDDGSIPALLDDIKPDAVVHCAANRFPDSVEANPVAAIALNVTSTRFLTSETYRRGILLIYISTDYVFSGKKGEAPYQTTDAVHPPNKYGQTKADGEEAVLKITSHKSGSTPSIAGSSDKVLGVVLRVPLLYGHCEDDDGSQSAVHVIVDAVRKARHSKVEIDDWSLRFPTATEDVGRVVKDIAELYLGDANKVTNGGDGLPSILQFSAKEQYTKYEMARFFALDVLGIPMDNVKATNPEKDQSGPGNVVNRPFDTQLATVELERLGVDTSTLEFEGWWRRELRAFRH